MEGYEETRVGNKNCTSYINITMKGMSKEIKESIQPLTDYVGPAYGAHGVIEGYEVTKMGNKQQYMSCIYTP